MDPSLRQAGPGDSSWVFHLMRGSLSKTRGDESRKEDEGLDAEKFVEGRATAGVLAPAVTGTGRPARLPAPGIDCTTTLNGLLLVDAFPETP